MEEKRFKVEEGGKRLDIYLREKLDFSRSLIQEWIKEGRVMVPGRKVTPHYRVREGDEIVVSIPPLSPQPEPEEIPLPIIYQDEDIVVINKPPGLIVHPAGKRRKGTLVNALLYYFPNSLSRLGGETRRGLVHRLDKGTSGVMIVARNDISHERVARQFQERKVKKVYLALVWGEPEKEEGEIFAPVGRDLRNRKKMSIYSPHGKTAFTKFRVKERFPGVAFLEVYPLTGRTHQIRVHLSSIGHPIVGDELYGGKKFSGSVLEMLRKKINRPLLHAYQITFLHPKSGKEMTFTAPLPEDFKTVLGFLRKELWRKK